MNGNNRRDVVRSVQLRRQIDWEAHFDQPLPHSLPPSQVSMLPSSIEVPLVKEHGIIATKQIGYSRLLSVIPEWILLELYG